MLLNAITKLKLKGWKVYFVGPIADRFMKTKDDFFKEHPELGLGNDVHSIRMNYTTDIDTVIYWLDRMNIEGLESPSPVEFLGGTQEMPVGFTSYFTVDIDLVNYAWISDSSSAKGWIKMFTFA